MLRVGLNPYGLTYYLGRQGRGTARANPARRGLDEFIDLAWSLGARTVELAEDWLADMDGAELSALGARLAALRMMPVLSSGLQRAEIDRCTRLATGIGARLIRLSLTSVLCGDRAATPDWPRLVESVWARLTAWTPPAAAAGLTLAIENHQDFTSEEMAAFCERLGQSVRIVLDTGNAFPVGEAPLDYARRVAPFVQYLHLKDYRVQPTEAGYRLVRCAIGDGAVPFRELAALLADYHDTLPAAIEPGALEARHVRLLTPQWWHGYAPRQATALAACLLAARRNALPPDADYRTPWERGDDDALEDYELDMIRRSVANVQAMGIMEDAP